MGIRLVPIGILIIAILGAVAVKPLLVTVRGQNAELKAFKQQITEAEAKKTALLALQPQMANAQAQINALKIAMPAAQQIPEVLVMMEAIAQKSGIQITGIDVQPNGGGNEVAVSLSGQGSYESLFTFTEVLEKNVRPIQIRSLSIGGTGQGNMVSATVSLGVIYQGAINQQVAPAAVSQ